MLVQQQCLSFTSRYPSTGRKKKEKLQVLDLLPGSLAFAYCQKWSLIALRSCEKMSTFLAYVRFAAKSDSNETPGVGHVINMRTVWSFGASMSLTCLENVALQTRHHAGRNTSPNKYFEDSIGMLSTKSQIKAMIGSSRVGQGVERVKRGFECGMD